MSEFNRNDWETSWGINYPTGGGVNDNQFLKIAETKLKTMKINKKNIEYVSFGYQDHKSRPRERSVPGKISNNGDWRRAIGKSRLEYS